MQDPTYDKQSFWKKAIQPQPQPQSQLSNQQQQQQQQISRKQYVNKEKILHEEEEEDEEVKSPTEYETTSIYMEFDGSSDSDDYIDDEDDDDNYIVQPTTTTLIRSGRRSPTMGPCPKNDSLCNNPFLSNGSNNNNNNNNNGNNDDYKLFRHKIIATNVMNRKRKKEISRRAQYRSNAVVIKTVYIMTMSTPSKSSINSQNTPSSSGQNVSPVKSTYKPRINGSFESKKRSKGSRSPTRNLIGFGKRQLLSSRKLK